MRTGKNVAATHGSHDESGGVKNETTDLRRRSECYTMRQKMADSDRGWDRRNITMNGLNAFPTWSQSMSRGYPP